MLNTIPHVTRLSGMMHAVEPAKASTSQQRQLSSGSNVCLIHSSQKQDLNSITVYFENFQALEVQLPLDKQLMFRLPLVCDLAYVTIDASALIIYLHVILRGMLSDATFYHQRRGLSAYLDCFRRACVIARQLGIFTVDTEHMPGDCSDMSNCMLTPDQKRFAFWQLLQTDCLFRQLFGKPPVIPFGSWHVRFPDLPRHLDGVKSQSSIQVHFIVSMRFAFITLRFLELLDTQGHVREDQVTELTLEIKSVVAEWDLVWLLITAAHKHPC